VVQVHRPEDERLLLLHKVVGGLAKEGSDQGHAGEGEDAGQQLGNVAGRDDVAVPDGGHCDHAEVECVQRAVAAAFAGHVVHGEVERGGPGEEVGEQEDADEPEPRPRTGEQPLWRHRWQCAAGALPAHVLPLENGSLLDVVRWRRLAAPEPSRPSRRRHLRTVAVM